MDLKQLSMAVFCVGSLSPINGFCSPPYDEDQQDLPANNTSIVGQAVNDFVNNIPTGPGAALGVVVDQIFNKIGTVQQDLDDINNQSEQ